MRKYDNLRCRNDEYRSDYNRICVPCHVLDLDELSMEYKDTFSCSLLGENYDVKVYVCPECGYVDYYVLDMNKWSGDYGWLRDILSCNDRYYE